MTEYGTAAGGWLAGDKTIRRLRRLGNLMRGHGPYTAVGGDIPALA